MDINIKSKMMLTGILLLLSAFVFMEILSFVSMKSMENARIQRITDMREIVNQNKALAEENRQLINENKALLNEIKDIESNEHKTDIGAKK